MGKLTQKFVREAPPGRHGDGQNLYLVVKKSGSKSWVLRYQYNGIRRDIGLGTAVVFNGADLEKLNIPLMHKRRLTLTEAREKAKLLLSYGRSGKNPIKERDKRKPFQPHETDRWTEAGVDDLTTVTRREMQMTPRQWTEKYSRHMNLLDNERQSWESRLAQLWHLQHGPKRTQPTYNPQQFQIEMLLAELEHTPKAKGFALQITSFVREWQSSRHPGYIDHALLLCRREGIFPPPTLVSVAIDAAEKRLRTDLPGMTPTKISRQSGLNFAMLIMANLVMSGATQEKASSKTAQLLVDEKFTHQWKASSLEKLYGKLANATKATVVKTIQGEWRHMDPDVQDQWRHLAAVLPEASYRVKGERR